MKMTIFEKLKSVYWRNTILSERQKEQLFYYLRNKIKDKSTINKIEDNSKLNEYVQYILNNQKLNNLFSIKYPEYEKQFLKSSDPKLIAYYLPQFYPNEYNNKWWGRGSTEWTNVSKAAPQYVGQYQPRFPGELGYYDLRIQDNIYRQIELAKIYGIYGFCFYYYWFDGIRLLDLPFDNYVNDANINFPFFICWVNESWTKQWSSSSNTPLIVQNKSVDSYKNFIKSCYGLFLKKNYMKIEDKVILNIYKPLDIPNPAEVIDYWRNFIFKELNMELYIIGVVTSFQNYSIDYKNIGFDSIAEFAPGAISHLFKDITKSKEFVCDSFYGKVYDYEEFVNNKKFSNNQLNKLYRAVIPMWDNTARKSNKGMIFDGATPELYKHWLKDIIIETKNNKNLDDNIIFINAWNEWAEGAYLEPDLRWQYGYLEATRDAILETRYLED